MADSPDTYIAFLGHSRIASGPLADVAHEVRARLDADPTASIAVFNASTSAPMDLDLRGTPEEVAEKAAFLAAGFPGKAFVMAGPSKPGPGRPKLGVVGREVTLLPRHWDWLASQPGGASVTIRKLVEAARKQGQGTQLIRQIQDVAHRFMYAIAGDLPGFEEAARALYAWDLARLENLIGEWPPDIRDHVMRIVDRAR
jgi:hypothetical protein